jgi:hypothetical protein
VVGQSQKLAANVSGQMQPVAVDGQIRLVKGLHNCVELKDCPYELYVTFNKDL